MCDATTCLGCDGDDGGGGGEGHDVRVADGEVHLLHLRYHPHQQPPRVVAVDPQQHAPLRQPCLDLRQLYTAGAATFIADRHGLVVAEVARLLHEHRRLDAAAAGAVGAVLLEGLDLLLQLPHVLRRVPKNGCLVHLQQ